MNYKLNQYSVKFFTVFLLCLSLSGCYVLPALPSKYNLGQIYILSTPQLNPTTASVPFETKKIYIESKFLKFVERDWPKERPQKLYDQFLTNLDNSLKPYGLIEVNDKAKADIAVKIDGWKMWENLSIEHFFLICEYSVFWTGTCNVTFSDGKSSFKKKYTVLQRDLFSWDKFESWVTFDEENIVENFSSALAADINSFAMGKGF